MPNLLVCSNCGNTVYEGDAHCMWCGAELSSQPAPPPPNPSEEVSCIHCGALIPRGDQYCMHCGGDQTLTPQPSTPEVPCRHCGQLMPQGDRYCPHCNGNQEDDGGSTTGAVTIALLYLTREEAADGCIKEEEVNGSLVSVGIPAGTKQFDKIDVSTPNGTVQFQVLFK